MFAKLRTWFIEKLGGYSTIDQAIDAIREIDYRERDRILTLAVKKLFNTIGSDDILRIGESGQWFFQNKPIAKEVATLLIAEATHFTSTKLWEILQADVKYQANRKMFILSKGDMDMTAGKLWVYTLNAFKTRLESMKAGSALFNTKE